MANDLKLFGESANTILNLVDQRSKESKRGRDSGDEAINIAVDEELECVDEGLYEVNKRLNRVTTSVSKHRKELLDVLSLVNPVPKTNEEIGYGLRHLEDVERARLYANKRVAEHASDEASKTADHVPHQRERNQKALYCLTEGLQHRFGRL